MDDDVTKQDLTTTANSDVAAPHGLCRVWLLLDRSASMAPTAEPMRRAINRFLARQSDLGGTSRLSIVGFDIDGIHLFADGLDLSCATSLRRAWFEPSGTTRLLSAIDAALDLIDETARARADASERPEDHLLLVVTDGADNAFDRPGADDRARRIEQLGAGGITVVSMAATAAARETLSVAGIPPGNIAHYLADDAGVESAWWWLDEATTRWRCRTRKARRRLAEHFLAEPS